MILLQKDRPQPRSQGRSGPSAPAAVSARGLHGSFLPPPHGPCSSQPARKPAPRLGSQEAGDGPTTTSAHHVSFFFFLGRTEHRGSRKLPSSTATTPSGLEAPATIIQEPPRSPAVSSSPTEQQHFRGTLQAAPQCQISSPVHAFRLYTLTVATLLDIGVLHWGWAHAISCSAVSVLKHSITLAKLFYSRRMICSHYHTPRPGLVQFFFSRLR